MHRRSVEIEQADVTPARCRRPRRCELTGAISQAYGDLLTVDQDTRQIEITGMGSRSEATGCVDRVHHARSRREGDDAWLLDSAPHMDGDLPEDHRGRGHRVGYDKDRTHPALPPPVADDKKQSA